MKTIWNPLKKMTTLEILVFVIFIIYLLLNIKTPRSIGELLSSPFGVVIILIITLWMFINTNPILGILTVFVAYELVRRSGDSLMNILTSTPSRVAIIQYNPVQIKRDIQIADMNANAETTVSSEQTLEEQIVKQMAPISYGEPTYIETGFRPIAESIHNATLFV